MAGKRRRADPVRDWQAIADAWRVGRLSIREIARQHGLSDTAIHKRAKREAWPPYGDLAPAIRRRIREILAAEDAGEVVVDQAAADQARVAERWPWLAANETGGT